MGNVYTRPPHRVTQAAIAFQLIAFAVAVYALVSKQWQVGNQHEIGLWIDCEPHLRCVTGSGQCDFGFCAGYTILIHILSAVSNDGQTVMQWTGIVIARSFLSASCGLVLMSTLPSVYMCTERHPNSNCCASSSMIFFAGNFAR